VQVIVTVEGPEAPEAARAIVQQAGSTLVPQYVGVHETGSERSFIAQVADRASAERLVGALMEVDEVTAAYLKPEDEPAGRAG
jgi:hypothetical protein